MSYVWARLKAVPLGLWAAFAAALAIFVLYLRGRRLEAELATTRLATENARAHAELSRGKRAAQRHFHNAGVHALRAQELEKARQLVAKSHRKDQATLAALPPAQVHDKYLELARKRRRELELEEEDDDHEP